MKPIMIEVNEPNDIFHSRDFSNNTVPASYKEIETLFCDSSGFGSEYEPALTPEQAKAKVTELLKKYKGKQLYSALTGIGQFQVYVTLYIKTKK